METKENAATGGASGDASRGVEDHEATRTRAERQAPSVNPQAADAIAFLRRWAPAGPWCLTAIPQEGGTTATRTFKPGQEDALVKWVSENNGLHQNCYFTVNAVRGDKRSKPKKADIAAALGLHIDIDPAAGADLAAEQERIKTLLAGAEPPPTVILFSGGGFQGLWRYDSPVADQEGTEARNKALMAALGGDAAWNYDRLLRLPGSINWPNEKKRQRGQQPVMAHVVDDLTDWSRTYGPGAFSIAEEDTQAAVPGGQQGATAPSWDGETCGPDDLDLTRFKDAYATKLRNLIINGPTATGRFGGDRSAAVWYVLCALARAGVPPKQALGILLNRKLGIAAHVFDQGRRFQQYAERQVGRAYAAVKESFQTDQKGMPVAGSQHNIRLALDKLGVELAHDQFADRLLIRGLPGYGPALDDAALDRLWLLVDDRYGFRPGYDLFCRCAADYARRNGYHPVRDYLDSLEWDGTPRLGKWLCTYGEAKNTVYVRAVGRLMLVAAVRRVRQPGAKFDEMLVLESTQGLDKSGALETLAVNEEWFTDDLPLDADTKRVIETLNGRWIVEAAELNGLRKGDVEHLKAFLSRRIDRARMAYGRMSKEAPRQCIIVGTSNNDKYLKDSTGNRRFWPVKVGVFDLATLRRDRDQLWAEAAHYEAEGESIRLPKRLWPVAAKHQEIRYTATAIEERLEKVLGDAKGGIMGKIRSDDVWRILGRGEASGRLPNQQETNERGAAMRRLGFEHGKRSFGGKTMNCYVRGTVDERGKEIIIHIDFETGVATALHAEADPACRAEDAKPEASIETKDEDEIPF